ncbi:interleukin-18-like [Eleutherodactylus coqui]|uniref:interleukin-18-like n=1 Tax=Eleutherodactylus coqui TaxID=57060 RepID=UPI0034624727
MQGMNFKVNDFRGKTPYYILNSHDDFLTAHPEESTAIFKSDEDLKEIIEVTYAMNFNVNKFRGKTPYHIQNSHDDFLTAHPEESIATFESDGDTKGERAMFYVNRYSEYDSGNGLPVVFSCRVDNKNYLLSAASNSVSLKEGGLPSEIPTKTSEFIFYIIEFSTARNALRFESSAVQKFCLAWSVQDTKKMLVLNPYHEDAINERMSFFIEVPSNIPPPK